MNKAVIGNKIMDFIDRDEFYNNREIYEDSKIALRINKGEEQYILPYRAKDGVMDKPGIYNIGALDMIKFPTTEEEKQMYSPEIIDFEHVTDMKDFKEKKEKLDKIEKEILQTTGADNTFKPPLLETDSPEMRAIKLAIIEKDINLDKYADRYGANYPNDKRKYKDDNITLYLIKRTCQCLDMKARIILEDKSPDVPNPIGRRIIADLTSGFEDEEK